MHYLARCSLSELNTLWEWGDLSISESNLRPPLIWYVESHESDQSFTFYIYIYAFSRRFYPKRLTLHSSYSFYILSALAFPGNRTHDLGVASAMFYQLSYRKAVRNQRGKLKTVSHREHLLTGAASVITHQLSLKGKAAADVAEVAINHNPLWCRRCGKCGRNRGMQSYNGIYRISRNVTEFVEVWMN